MNPTPATTPMPPRKSHKGLIIGLIVLLLILALVGLALAKHGSKPTNTASSTTAANTAAPAVKANQFTAASLTDYSKVCQGSMATNAAAYTGLKPHPLVMFVPSLSANDFLQSSASISDSTWLADSKKPETAQLVGCFTRKSEAASPKNCNFQDSSKKTINIPFVPVVYTLTLYEAKTGKKVTTVDISGPATTCPLIASYDPANPKIYADPDPGQTGTALTAFVNK